MMFVANESLLTGITSESMLKGNITLIPKKEDSNDVNDLRPITLLEISRKIITKAMTQRIKQCLLKNNLISENQFCHPGRLIHDNVHAVNLLVERAKESGTDLHAMFLDCSNFDSVNHIYLEKVLEKRDCGEYFLNFIKCFLKGTSRIRFNESLSEELKVDRGVPQGETLSPFLFILAINPLLISIQNDRQIEGASIWKKRIKVLAYADDLVLIAEKAEELEKMLDHVERYERASNAKPNQKKSQIISFGPNKIERIREIEHCKEGEKVRHLGFFFDHNGLVNNIDEILQKVLKKLKILRNLFPNFRTRVNIWKGYAISSLLYQSELITITKKQIAIYKEMENYFFLRATLMMTIFSK
eukprot:TRINITY_DN2972_c0_g2_i10.p1 TRINITY_DN2972_c0_g2~~TRINITY_DN2972_c0_g2_i10.p1  ORF type:complete len:358 (+),score=91.08 TRINITY_DN2972_c0_g2_i10:503-1576(+)